MTDYPMHDKLAALKGANQTIGEFLEWLTEEGLIICKRVTDTSLGGGHYESVESTREQLIAEYFDINATELGREKDRMMEEVRKAAGQTS